MLCEGIEAAVVEVEAAPTWAPDGPQETQLDWRAVDRALRAIRRSRAALDAEEMHWLREAEVLQIWRPFGMVSALDYLERALGYAPRTAQDRLRVARALGPLPRLTAALSSDELAFSAVRELTRVATPATEAAWITAAAGKNLRQVEELVADHRPGDRPDDPPDPTARTHVVRFELAAETFALLRQARTVLDDEHGTNLSDDELVAALCSAVLDGASPTETTGRARYQIAVTVCQRCRRGWQEGAGAQIAIEPEVVDRVLCDAQHIGSIDGAAPERAYQDIPPSIARFVWRRDGGRCRVPGCRSSRGLELHHLVHRADGGSHDALNLAILCSACHLAHHRGALTMTGTADHLEVRRPGQANSAARFANSPIHPGPRATDAHVGVGAGDAATSAARIADLPIHPGPRATGAHVGVGAGDAATSAARIADLPIHPGPSATGAHVGCDQAMLVRKERKVRSPS
ncbi:MAG: HNH endonuclease, partial [Deltaproteobacteria bacterium]